MPPALCIDLATVRPSIARGGVRVIAQLYACVCIMRRVHVPHDQARPTGGHSWRQRGSQRSPRKPRLLAATPLQLPLSIPYGLQKAATMRPKVRSRCSPGRVGRLPCAGSAPSAELGSLLCVVAHVSFALCTRQPGASSCVQHAQSTRGCGGGSHACSGPVAHADSVLLPILCVGYLPRAAAAPAAPARPHDLAQSQQPSSKQQPRLLVSNTSAPNLHTATQQAGRV